MPKRIKVDNKKLFNLVKNGTPQKEIMKQFGFSNSSQLKVAYANALMEEGKAPEIKVSRAVKKKKAASREVKVSKRGSVSIPKNIIADLGFKQGDAFTVRKTKAGISLKKA